MAAKEAANMVDLDSDPTKIIEVVETGKQLLMTRGSLTTFSIVNDVAKYFAIMSATMPALIPIAMKGIKYKPMSSTKLLARNMLIFGLGGIITPFIGIKLIDLLVSLAF